jgi:hypothetical protein
VPRLPAAFARPQPEPEPPPPEGQPNSGTAGPLPTRPLFWFLARLWPLVGNIVLELLAPRPQRQAPAPDALYRRPPPPALGPAAPLRLFSTKIHDRREHPHGSSLRQHWTPAFLLGLVAVRAVLIIRGRANIERSSLNNLGVKRTWEITSLHKRIGQTREENTPKVRHRKKYRKHHRCLEKDQRMGKTQRAENCGPRGVELKPYRGQPSGWYEGTPVLCDEAGRKDRRGR